MEEIYHVLQKIGLRSHYTGYEYLAWSIYFTVQNNQNNMFINTLFYDKIANKFNTTKGAVESDIRNVIKSYWLQYEDKVIYLHLGFHIYMKPSPRDFIEMLSDCIIRQNRKKMDYHI